MKKLPLSLIICAGALLQGCVSLLPESSPPKPRYQIVAATTPDQGATALSWSLIIADPRTTRVYDSVRVAVKTAPGKIEYYAGAEWADRAPRLFQIALVETFQDSERILSVGDPSGVPIGDLTLQTEIRDASLNVQDGNSNVDVSIYARLTNGKGTVHAVRKFESKKTATTKQADDVMAAYNAAFGEVITAITAWTYEQGERVFEESPQS